MLDIRRARRSLATVSDAVARAFIFVSELAYAAQNIVARFLLLLLSFHFSTTPLLRPFVWSILVFNTDIQGSGHVLYDGAQIAFLVGQ